MSYQGVLTDDGGEAVPDGEYSLTFHQLIGGASGGAEVEGHADGYVKVWMTE